MKNFKIQSIFFTKRHFCNFILQIAFFFALFYVSSAFAISTNCENLFPDVLQSSGESTTPGITLPTTAANFPIVSNPDASLGSQAATFSNTGAVACTGGACVATGDYAGIMTGPSAATFNPGTAGADDINTGSGTVLVTLANFPTQCIPSGGITTCRFRDINVQNNGTITFSLVNAIYKIRQLTINTNTTVNFAPGEYYIGSTAPNNANTLTFAGNAATNRTATVSSDGTARVFVNVPVNFNSRVTWNTPASLNRKFFLMTTTTTTPSITINNAAFEMRGFLYSRRGINYTLAGQLTAQGLTGGMTANSFTFTNNVKRSVYESPTASSTVNFSPATCTIPSFTVAVPAGPYSNCTNIAVTVTKLTEAGAVETTYASGTTRVVLSTNGTTCTSAGGTNCFGTWTLSSGVGAFNNFGSSGNGNGYAEYQFLAGDNGDAVFNLNYPAAGLLNPTLTAYLKNNSLIQGTNSSITFSPSSYLVSESSSPTQYAGNFNAGDRKALNIVASTSCGVMAGYTGNKNIKFWFNYLNPATSAGTSMTIVPPAGATPSTETTIGTTEPGGATFTNLSFTSGVTTATFSARYKDAGQLRLNVKDANNSAFSGSSGNFVVKPILNVSIVSPTNPGGSAATDAVFTTAGTPFTVNVTGKTTGADSMAVVTTPNFGNETSPEGVNLQAALNTPVGGVLGALVVPPLVSGSNLPKTAPGTFQSNAIKYREVGSINLSAIVASGNYLGTGSLTSNTISPVGRFKPHHFTVALDTGNVPQFQTGCGTGASTSFTYLDKAFTYSTNPIMNVKPMDQDETITQNYTGTFKKLSSTNFAPANVTYANTGGSPAAAVDTSTAGLANPTEGGNATTGYTYTFTAGSGIKLNRPAASATPLTNFDANITLSIPVTDSDSVSASTNPFVIGSGGSGIAFNHSKQFYHGRLFIQNANGPENSSLNVPMEAQYYTGTGFTRNTLDNCTSVSASNISVLAGSTVSVTPQITTPLFASGSNNILLPAPNATGYAILEANLTSGGANLPWLQFDWPWVSGSAYENPRAQANFGIYTGNPRVIFQQENYP